MGHLEVLYDVWAAVLHVGVLLGGAGLGAWLLMKMPFSRKALDKILG